MNAYTHTHTHIHTHTHTHTHTHIYIYIYITANITAKAAFKFGSEVWVLNKRDKQRLEAAEMKFLRHLLGITKLDRENIQVLEKKLGHRT